MIYKNEKIEIKWVIIFSIFYLPVIYFIWYLINKNEMTTESLLFMIVWICFVTFIMFSYLKDPLKTRRKNKKIKENGIKYQGYIEKFDYDASLKSNGYGLDDPPDWKIVKEFTLDISYIDKDGKKQIFKTPVVNFNSVSDLASRNCNVYVLDNEIYVTDFEKNTGQAYSLWSNDSEEVQDIIKKDAEVQKEKNAIMKFSLIIVGILILISVILGILSSIK